MSLVLWLLIIERVWAAVVRHVQDLTAPSTFSVNSIQADLSLCILRMTTVTLLLYCGAFAVDSL